MGIHKSIFQVLENLAGDSPSVVNEDPQGIRLDAEQLAVIEAVKRRESVLVTGPAGTGKSAVLEHLCKILPVAVTSTTGLSAVNIGGVTIHSWSGMGIGGDPDAVLQKVSGYVRDRINNTQYLAIDEISMLGGSGIDLLHFILSSVRCDRRPFGGMVMIFFGDFMQLPPVDDEEMAFESMAWQELNPRIINLTRIYRQDDPKFQNMLNEIRLGKIGEESATLLASRINISDDDPEREPLHLYPTNKSVDRENHMRVSQLPGEMVTYLAEDWAQHPVQLANMKKSCRWPELLELKVGARVMLLFNKDVENGLANGSMGLVRDIRGPEGVIVVEFDIGPGVMVEIRRGTFEIRQMEKMYGSWTSTVVATRKQHPLRLAYALTAHKSQGLSLDKVRVHLAGCFDAGQAYVALSRVRTLNGLFIGDFEKGCIRANRAARRYYGGIQTS